MRGRDAISLTFMGLMACGPSAILDVVDLPPGAECPFGGVAIHSGEDVDGDGSLTGAEITDTSYVCAGDPGSSATPTEPRGETDLAAIIDTTAATTVTIVAVSTTATVAAVATITITTANNTGRWR